MEIPAHVQAAIGIGSPATEDQLATAADAWPAAQTTFGLSGKEFTEAIVKAQTEGGSIVVSRPTRVNRSSWKYLELFNKGDLESWSLSTPNAGAVSPPTAVGQGLVKAWLLDPTIIDNGISPGLLVHGTARNASLANFTHLLAKEWVDICFFLEGLPTFPSWVGKSRIDIAPDARITNTTTSLKYERLLLEAVSEFKAKWRFLSLYRILEHGYLLQVFQTLEADFFNLPEVSLDAALKLVKSELKQFVALAEKTPLQNEFKNFFDEFQKHKVAGNKLAHAIEHSIKQMNQQNQVNGDWQMGVLLCYKLRCSIVHSGLSAPIFDAYADGPALLEAVLPICESITLSFIGITIT
jgi:hypothetical protein